MTPIAERAAAGDGRSADPQGRLARADARLGDQPAHPADHARRARGESGRALSRAPPPRRPGLARRRVGNVGEQSTREVLHAHRRRPETAHRRNRARGSATPPPFNSSFAPSEDPCSHHASSFAACAISCAAAVSIATSTTSCAFTSRCKRRRSSRQGMSPGRARAKAESDFGVGARVTDHVREARGLSAANVVDDAMRDVRFAVRSLARTPAFTRRRGRDARARHRRDDGDVQRRERRAAQRTSVSARRSSRRAARARRLRGSRVSPAAVSAPNFRRLARAGASHRPHGGLSRRRDDGARPCRADAARNVYAVSHDYFQLFGGTPVRRTHLHRRRERRQRRAGRRRELHVLARSTRRRDAICRRVRSADVGQHAIAIIGVMPRGFGYPDDAQIWIPLEPQNATMGRDSHNDDTIGRLAPGVTRRAAPRRELQGNRRASEEGVSDAQRARSARRSIGLRDALVGPVRTYLRLLLLAVARRAARRVREPRERQSRARRRSRARAGDSHRARRRARPSRATAADRERAHRALPAARLGVRARALARARACSRSIRMRSRAPARSASTDRCCCSRSASTRRPREC